MSRGFGMALDDALVMKAMAAISADESGGITEIKETPMRGLTARMVIKNLSVATGSGAVRLRILAAQDSGESFVTIAASPAITTMTTEGATGDEGQEILVRFGTDYNWIKYVLDAWGSVSGSAEIGLVEDGVRFPDWDQGGAAVLWTDGGDIIV